MNKGHSWSKDDDIIAFYLYKFGDKDLPLTLREIAQKRGIQVNAMRMRMANYKFLDGKGGLNHPSKQSREVYKEYNDMKKEDFQKLVIKLLSVNG